MMKSGKTQRRGFSSWLELYKSFSEGKTTIEYGIIIYGVWT